MKKTLFTLVAATAMILGLAGCDTFKSDGLDNDSESWGGQVSKETKDATEQYTATMTVSDDFEPATDWCVWTDVKGIVLPTQPTKKVNADKSITWTFSKEILDLNDYNQSPSSEYFVLYIHINGTDKKAGSLENKDVRGRIMIYNNRKVTFESKNYKEVIEPVGIVTIENDEPVSNSTFKNGNYAITAIYPLNPKADEADTDEAMVNNKVGGKYVVEDTMLFENLNVEQNKKISFPVKAGKQIIGLYQEKRADNFKVADISDSEKYSGPKTKKEIAEDEYIKIDGKSVTRAELLDLDIKDSDDDKAAVTKYVAANKKLIFGKTMAIEAHKENKTAVKTSTFGDFWFVKKTNNMLRAKTAYDDAVEVEVFSTPIEK